MREKQPHQCPICKQALHEAGRDSELQEFDCVNCGQFKLTGTAKVMIKARNSDIPNFGAALSHAVYKMQSKQPWPTVTENLGSVLTF